MAIVATATSADLVARLIVIDVPSFTDRNKSYEVHLPYCSCPDMLYRDLEGVQHACKHLQRLYEKMGHYVQCGGITVRPKLVEVQSFTDPNTSYTVQLPFCECPKFRWSPAGDWERCKHFFRAYELAAAWRQW